jgi:hypothetical protein
MNHIVQPTVRMADIDRDMFGIVMHVAFGKPNPPTAHLYEWQGLAGYNAFMVGGVNRQHYYKSLGVMAMTGQPSAWPISTVICSA